MSDASPARICAVVLTLNEQRHIGECLATLDWADERLVFDSFSADATVTIAQQAGARVIRHPFENYAQQRNAALAAADSDWVFFVDADERCTDALAREILQVIGRAEAASPQPSHDVWSVPRYNYIFGKLTTGAGWYPDYQARLFRVGKVWFDPVREVHERPKFDGQLGYLKHELIHYNYDSVEQFHDKQRRYVEYDASILYKQGIRPKPRNFVLQPLREFRRRYFSLKGYRDGLHGLHLSALMAYYNFDMYRRLARMWREKIKDDR